MEKIIKTAMGVGNTAVGMENIGTYPMRDAEKLAGAINNLANAIDRLNEQGGGNEYAKRIRIRGELSGNKEHIEAHKEYLAISKQDTPEEIDPTKGCDCDFCRGYRWSHEKEENTPEETERWEEGLNNLKARLNGLPVVVEREIDDIKDIIKQLLEEKEREAREEGIREVCEMLGIEYLKGGKLVVGSDFKSKLSK